MHGIYNCHEDCQVISRNICRPRSYYIPYGSYLDAVERPKEKSDRLINLAGSWNYKMYGDIRDVPDMSSETAKGKVYGKNITLPSNVETAKLDIPQANEAYPFPCDIPYTAPVNPAAVFMRDFYVDEQFDGFKKYFVCEGGSPYYLFVNGHFAGYTQGRCKLSEFDISSFVNTGKNSICIVTLKYADSSYLECQDMISLWGIFGDIYILARPKGHIIDYKITTKLANAMRGANIYVNVKSILSDGINITIIDPNGEAVESKPANEDGMAEFYIETPYIWSAESPDLYTVVISQSGEYIAAKTGIRDIEIENGILKINNRIVKLKGVVFNPVSPVSGYAMTAEEMHNSLIHMKKNNINAVKFNQPPLPVMLQLCDSIGMYVINDTGIDCSFMPEGMDASEIPVLREAYIDRAKCMYERDKNSASVIIWSLGRNAGEGGSLKACGDYLKQHDNRPVMYEGDNYDIAGVYSEQAAEDIQNIKPMPVIVCSFTHNAKRMWERVMAYDGLSGAFFNEWCETGIKITSNGKNIYYTESSLSAKDGKLACKTFLISCTGYEMPMLRDIKNVYAPVRVEPIDLSCGRFKVYNLYDFVYLSRLELFYEISRDGKMMESKSVGTLTIPPQKSQEIDIGYFLPDGGDCYVRCVFKQAGESAWAPYGHEMAFTQFKLPCEEIKPVQIMEYTAVKTEEDEKYITFTGNEFEYKFSKYTGLINDISVNGKSFTTFPLCLTAKTVSGIKAGTRLYHYDYDADDANIKIKAALSLCADGYVPFAEVEAEYSIISTGDMDMLFKVSSLDNSERIAKFGIKIPAAQEFINAEYFAYGPGINTAEMKSGAVFGNFVTNASKMTKESIICRRPPHRYGAKWAGIYDESRIGMLICGEFIFGFLKDDETNTAYAGYIQDGLKNELDSSFEFHLLLRPIKPDGRKLSEISNMAYKMYGGYQISL